MEGGCTAHQQVAPSGAAGSSKRVLRATGLPLLLLILAGLGGCVVTGPVDHANTGGQFVDEAAAAGLNVILTPPAASANTMLAERNSLGGYASDMRTMTGGIAVADVDRNGAPDLLFSRPGHDLLYLGRGDGTFLDASSWIPEVADWNGTMGLFFDYDGDGYADLFAGQWHGPSILLHNDQGRGFHDATQATGLFVDAPVQGAAAADVDHDGRVDLFVVAYLQWYGNGTTTAAPVPGHAEPPSQAGAPAQASAPGAAMGQVPAGSDPAARDTLWMNHGDHFTEEAAERGIVEARAGLAASFADFDGDGWLDLYVANDFAGGSQLWHNLDGTFVDVARQTGALSQRDGMGATWFDADDDGRPDVYVSNIRYDPPLSKESQGNELFLNTPDGFKEVGHGAGVERAGWSWGACVLDAESDGDVDLYVPNGYPLPDLGAGARATAPANGSTMATALPPAEGGRAPDLRPRPEDLPVELRMDMQPQRFFENLGHATFSERAGIWGVAAGRDGRGCATLDANQDGALDFVTTQTGHAPRLYINHAAQGNLIVLRLVGQGANPDALGARVLVRRDLTDGENGSDGAGAGSVGGNAAGSGSAGERGTPAGDAAAPGGSASSAVSSTSWHEVQAGGGYLSQSQADLHIGLGPSSTASVAIHWPSGRLQDIPALGPGRYVLTEGKGLASMAAATPLDVPVPRDPVRQS